MSVATERMGAFWGMAATGVPGNAGLESGVCRGDGGQDRCREREQEQEHPLQSTPIPAKKSDSPLVILASATHGSALGLQGAAAHSESLAFCLLPLRRGNSFAVSILTRAPSLRSPLGQRGWLGWGGGDSGRILRNSRQLGWRLRIGVHLQIRFNARQMLGQLRDSLQM